MKLPTIPDQVPLSSQGGIETRDHLFEDDSRYAILAALGASRPLLVRGEPGVGKTQLAEAAAVTLNRLLLSHVVDSRTETRDLLYTYDSVRRLAEAQLCGSLKNLSPEEISQRLAAERFLAPGPLWWTFSWESAMKQAKLSETGFRYTQEQWEATSGVVLLIDEIDKAETDVPNGLLDALGSRSFTSPVWPEPVEMKGETPLIIITSNEERSLPDPFLRRCIVLDLNLPGEFDDEGKNEELHAWLIKRGRVHFPKEKLDECVLQKAADLLIEDRHEATTQEWSPLPGQAEYLDLLRAVVELEPGKKSVQKQLDLLEKIRKFVLRKHRVAP